MDASSSSISAEELFRQAQAKETAYREALGVRGQEEKAKELRRSLQKTFEKIFEADTGFAIAREVESLVWKLCFYKKIEDIRKTIREGPRRIKDFESRKELYIKKLQEYLDDARSFYLKAINLACSALNISTEVVFVQMPKKFPLASATFPGRFVDFSYQVLIYLGDISRYSQQSKSVLEADWTESSAHYQRASLLKPENGLPHNQLGVISSSMGNCLEVLYRYTRSLVSKQSYEQSRVNMNSFLVAQREQGLSETSAPRTFQENLRQNQKLFTLIHSYVWTKKWTEAANPLIDKYSASLLELLKTASKVDICEVESTIQKCFLVNVASWSVLSYNEEEFKTNAEISMKQPTLDSIKRVMESLVATLLSVSHDCIKNREGKGFLLSSCSSILWMFTEYYLQEQSGMRARLGTRLLIKGTIWNDLALLVNHFKNLCDEKAGNEWKKFYFVPEDIDLRGLAPFSKSRYLLDSDQKSFKALAESDNMRLSMRMSRLFESVAQLSSTKEERKVIYYSARDDLFTADAPNQQKSHKQSRTPLLSPSLIDQFDAFLDGDIPNREELTSLIRNQSKNGIRAPSNESSESDSGSQRDDDNEGDDNEASTKKSSQAAFESSLADTSTNGLHTELKEKTNASPNSPGTTLPPFPSTAIQNAANSALSSFQPLVSSNYFFASLDPSAAFGQSKHLIPKVSVSPNSSANSKAKADSPVGKSPSLDASSQQVFDSK